jgi:hypothetical protein
VPVKRETGITSIREHSPSIRARPGCTRGDTHVWAVLRRRGGSFRVYPCELENAAGRDRVPCNAERNAEMDVRQFDALTRAAGRWMTRRLIFTLIAGAGQAARVFGEISASQKRKKPKKKNSRCQRPCPECTSCRLVKVPCGRACDGLGRRCVPVTDGTACVGGGGTTCCSGHCRDLQTDSANCGACFNACGPGRTCNEGRCPP